MNLKISFFIKLFFLSILFTPFWTSASEFNVLDFGAKGDGKTDNTAAFQAAIEKAGETGGTVLVPAGQFRFDGVLTLASGVTLKGIAEGPPAANLERGTLFMAFAGRDDEDSSPFITMDRTTLEIYSCGH